MSKLVRKYWCSRRHDWKPNRHPAEIIGPVASNCTGSWSRKPCRFCAKDWPAPEGRVTPFRTYR